MSAAAIASTSMYIQNGEPLRIGRNAPPTATSIRMWSGGSRIIHDRDRQGLPDALRPCR